MNANQQQRLPQEDRRAMGLHKEIVSMLEELNGWRTSGETNTIIEKTLRKLRETIARHKQFYQELDQDEKASTLHGYLASLEKKCKTDTTKTGDPRKVPKEHNILFFKLEGLGRIFDTNKSPAHTKVINHDANEAISEWKRKVNELEEENRKLQESLKEERAAKEDAYTRLSKHAADRMKTGNPEITDLSDPNRPLKLADQFGELYCNEWTDALEYLQNKREENKSVIRRRTEETSEKNLEQEKETTQFLFNTLKKCYEYCKEEAELQEKAIIMAGMGHFNWNMNEKAGPQNVDPRKTIASGDIRQEQKPGPQNVDPRKTIASGDIRQEQKAGPQNVDPRKTIASGDIRQEQKVKKDTSMSVSREVSSDWSAPQTLNAQKMDASGQRLQDEKVNSKPSKALEAASKEFRKCAADDSVNLIPKKISKRVITEKDLQEGKMHAYVEKCSKLCWLMLIQFPPVELVFDIIQGAKFEDKYMIPYLNAGKKVAFPVWPIMFLQHDGQILRKGVVECFRNK